MLTTDNTMLIVTDIQGSLAQAMHEKESLFENLKRIIQGAAILELPIIVTEQYPKGLGPTMPDIAELFPDIQPISKLHFSSCSDDGCMQAIAATKRNQVLMTGIETHICVYQTTRELLARGYDVEVVTDAVASRTLANKEIGLARMQAHGANITCVEMALYELLKIAQGPQFKAILKLIK